MNLPSFPNSINFQQIRDNFAGKTINGSNYGSDNTNLFNMNFYRGKNYYTSRFGTTATFPSGTISFNTFHGKQDNCAGGGSDCDCDCDGCP